MFASSPRQPLSLSWPALPATPLSPEANRMVMPIRASFINLHRVSTRKVL